MTEGLGAFRDAISNLEGAANAANSGMIQAEDGSWVPPSFYAEQAPPDDDSFESNSYYDENANRPGYMQAEDGSWVPADYWD